MATITERLVARVEAKTGPFVRGMKGVLSITKRLTRGYKLFGLTAAGALTLSIKLSADLEKALAEVHTLVEADASAFEGYTKRVLDMSSKIGKSAKELSSGLYQAISAGVEFGGSIEFVEKASKLAISGVSDLYTSVDILTGVVNAYGKEVYSVDEASDILMQTVIGAKTRLTELSFHLGKVLSVSAMLGVGLEELSAVIGAGTKQQIRMEQVTTGLRQMLMMMLDPQKEAIALAKKLEINWGTAAIRGTSFTAVLAELKEKVGSNEKALKKFFPMTEAMPLVMALMGKGFTDYIQLLEDAEHAQGKTQAGFEKMEATLSRKMEKLWTRIKNLAIIVGDVFGPALKQMADDLGGATEGFRKWLVESGYVEAAQKILAKGWEYIWEKIKSTATAAWERVSTVFGSMERTTLSLTLAFAKLSNYWVDFKATWSDIFGLEGDNWERVMNMRNKKFSQLNRQLEDGTITMDEYGEKVKEVLEWEKKKDENYESYIKRLQGWSTTNAENTRVINHARKRLKELDAAEQERLKNIEKDGKKEIDTRQDAIDAMNKQFWTFEEGTQKEKGQIQSLLESIEKGKNYKNRLYTEEEKEKELIRASAERKEVAHMERLTKFFKDELEQQTDSYLEEYQERLSYAEDIQRRISELEGEQGREAESFEERMHHLRTQHMTERGKMIQTAFMAEDFWNRAMRQQAEGDYEEARRLTKKAMDYWEEIAYNIMGPDREEAIRRMNMAEAKFQELATMEKAEAQAAGEANKQRIDALLSQIDALQEKAMAGVSVNVETDQAQKEIADLRKQLDALRDRIITITARASVRTIEHKACGGIVGSEIQGSPAGWLAKGTDRTLVNMTPGEYVTPVHQTRQSIRTLQAIRRGELTDAKLSRGVIPRLEAGGPVPQTSGGGGGDTWNLYFTEEVTDSTIRNKFIPAMRKARQRGWM